MSTISLLSSRLDSVMSTMSLLSSRLDSVRSKCRLECLNLNCKEVFLQSGVLMCLEWNEMQDIHERTCQWMNDCPVALPHAFNRLLNPTCMCERSPACRSAWRERAWRPSSIQNNRKDTSKILHMSGFPSPSKPTEPHAARPTPVGRFPLMICSNVLLNNT